MREERGREEGGNIVSRARVQSECQRRSDAGGMWIGGDACLMSATASGSMISSVIEASAAQFPGMGMRKLPPIIGQESGPRRM